MPQVTYKMDLEGVNWQEMMDTLIEDDFHNHRTVQQYRISFENSAVTCIAYIEGRIVGTARALSDGVCNAYIIDVWTYTPYRRQGIARRMMEKVLAELRGQHVYLWTDDAQVFYERLGMNKDASTGYSQVVGQWLQNASRDA